MATRRALVVDGDWKIRKLIRTNLEVYGLEVVEAGDGKACFASVKKGAYELILLSGQLPDANGWNVAHELRRQAVGPEVPIIMVVKES